jgi:thioredoxin 1
LQANFAAKLDFFAAMSQTPDVDPQQSSQRWVIGLCAQWCGVCRDWRAAFDAAAARHPQDRFVWVDVEDQADAVGDVDIETFPTLLVGQQGLVQFFGTVLPSAELLGRLLDSLDAATPGVGASAEAQALLQRLLRQHL